MALDATGRSRVLAHVMRSLPAALAPFPAVTKAELAAAVAATDDWIETNTTSFNAALPTPFRTRATPAQKVWLFCYVAMRRADLLRTQEDS